MSTAELPFDIQELTQLLVDDLDLLSAAELDLTAEERAEFEERELS